MRYSIAILLLFASTIIAGCDRSERPVAAQRTLPAGDPDAGKAVFQEAQCWTCHEIYGGGFPAPTAKPQVPAYLGGNQIEAPDDLYLVAAIVNPSHELAPGWARDLMTTPGGTSRMPTYAEALTARQLFDLVSFLKSRYGREL